MDYEIVSKININKDGCSKVGEFLYNHMLDALYFEGKYPFPVQLGVSHNLTQMEVTPMFLKLPFILRGWINLDMLRREIDLIKLVGENKLLLHASCVDDTLIVGFPNSGKTYMTINGISRGFPLVSEEYTIISEKTASPYKRIARSCLSFRTCYDFQLSLTGKERLQLALNGLRAWLMPFIFENVIWKELPLSGKTAEVKRIVYGSSGEEIKDYKKLIILTENEFPYMADAFLEAYAFITGFDLIAIQEKQRQLIKEFVSAVYSNTK